jgi:uncharacterized protein
MASVDIASLKKALLNPGIYPDHPREVGFCETHISLLFFTGRQVYKVKKPVNFGFLDFTSLEKRHYFCNQEVNLNRRLAPSLYLGVVTITKDQGAIFLSGPGEVIDYAVQMEQIPEDLLMDKLLQENRVTASMIEAIAGKLAHFYATAESGESIDRFARPDRIKQDTDENFEQTGKYVDVTIPQNIYTEIKEKTNAFFKTREDVFHERIKAGKIRDCHGDLRLEHIYWGKEIAIFDCIEFNERFRYTDVAADIAFLAMDLDYHDRQELADDLLRAYVIRSGDEGIMAVLNFYKGYRAYVRGKVESFQMDDPNIPEERKREAGLGARRYFELSHRYALRF